MPSGLKSFINQNKFFQLPQNRLLRRGSMFVFSLSQFMELTSWNENFSTIAKPKLLDLGSGDGAVTSVISKLFDEVYVTEVSPTMKWILAEKGFRERFLGQKYKDKVAEALREGERRILDIEKWALGPTKFEVITCLNLLDRCDTPVAILNDMKKVLQPNGLVVLAMVLPFKPFVESKRGHVPSQSLDIEGWTFEEQVGSIAKKVLEPIGYEIVRWTRLPYLCEGDLRQSYYWLDDVVFVLKLSNKTE